MNELQLFQNQEFGDIRAMQIDGKPYVVGVDVARALGYADANRAIRDHCKGTCVLPVPSTNQHGATVIQDTNVIPEGDIYRLIIKAADQSRNPEIKEKASRFERWLFDDIIPAIRQTGFYIDGNISASNVKLLQQTVNALADTIAKLTSTENERKLLEVKLDESMRYWSIKRRCALLNIDYNWYLDKTGKNQGWRKLIALSHAMGRLITKVPDANYPEGVNVYDIDVMVEAERLFEEGKTA